MQVAFLYLSKYVGFLSFSPDALSAVSARLISDPSSTLLVADDDGNLCGMIGMMVYPHPLSGDVTATEVFWWVDPNRRGRLGVRLWNEAEIWAKQQGATRIQMIAPDDDVAKLYRRRGYRRLETIYQRSL